MVSDERLRELREALIFGDPLDERARLDLLAILERAGVEPRRGRPTDKLLRRRAGVVGVLHEQHGIGLKQALFAAAPTASWRERERLRAAYHALQAKGETVRVPERAARAALSALRRAPRKIG